MRDTDRKQPQSDVSIKRRSFLKWSAALGGMAALPGCTLDNLKPTTGKPVAQSKVIWSSCNVNCGSRCALRVHVTDGVVTRVETDNLGDDTYGNHQVRACLRGRSMRHRMYAPDRLKYPMRRTGKRGEGKFERISWDEAYDEIAKRLKKTIAEHGNESVYINYATGALGNTISKSWPPHATPIARLMNCLGGWLQQYNTYSTAMIKTALPYTFGGKWVDGNTLVDTENSELVIFFGNNPAETRMSGGGQMYDLLNAKKRGKAKLIVIDPRHTDTVTYAADEWIPIRPGTDAALVSSLAYVLITENLADTEFLKRYTVGFDEESMPDGIPAGNSYKSYILGKGTDKTAKTPAWASRITGISEKRIINLAREMVKAKPCYISQGWSCQRQANGEQNARAIAMLPILTGNVGIQGGNTGAREGMVHASFASFPVLKNPIKTKISMFTWTDAIERGTEMTAKADGVRGRDRLITPIKFVWNYAGNCIINQHSDINRTHEILQDDSKCETIVVVENFMTASARYADILLPGTINLEEDDVTNSVWTSELAYLIFAKQAAKPFYESRDIYQICSGIAGRLGVEQMFTEGRNRQQWALHLYEEARKTKPELPQTLDSAFDIGIIKYQRKGLPKVPFKAFRENPEKNPLETPSGKIEIFSKRLWDISHEWDLAEGDVISGLPEYALTWDGLEDPKIERYPIQLIGHHYKQRTHSTYGNVDWLQRVAPQMLWMNPIDADARDITHGDKVKIFNDRGTVFTVAKVTPRIMPGVMSLPQGAWYKPDSKGNDTGGCINVLTSMRPSPLAKGNPQHTNLVQVEKT